MDLITETGTETEIGAALVAKGLRPAPEALRAALRDGHVTRTIAKGEHLGRFRVTFHAPTRRLRLLFTADGDIMQTSAADDGRKARP